MKQKLILMFALLTSIMSANATNGVVMGDKSVSQGGTGVISVELNNDDYEFTAYQFQIVLPEGLSFVADKKGNPSFVEGDRYDDHYFLSSSSGMFACASNSLAPISGTSGILMNIYITADAELVAGTKLDVTLSNIEFTKTDGFTGVKFEDVTCQISITEKTYTLLDETSLTAPTASDGEVDIKVKRTINANEWSTLVLPFDMTEAQLKTALGADVQLAEFTDYEAEYDGEDNVIGIAVNFDEADLSEGFYANYPYLVKTSQKITEFIVTSTITPDEENAVAEYDNGKTGKNRKVYGSLIGTYHAGDAIPANGLFLSENKFWYSVGTTAIKAFRAYFQFNDVLSDMEAASKVRFTIEDATGIKELKNEIVEGLKLGWYTLDGRRLSGKPTAKGTYINDGRKVSVR